MQRCSEIAFSTRQNAENEHSETLKKQVHELNFSLLVMLRQFVRCCVSVILLEPSGFSMPGILSSANMSQRSTYISYVSLCSF